MKKFSKRFKKPVLKIFNKYTNSFKYDKKLIKEEILCLNAHTEMLFRIKIINKKEFNIIKKGLKFLNFKKLNFKENFEDIHFYLENELIKKIGNPGKKIRIAKSRNDLVTTDLRIWIKKRIKKIILLIKKNISILLKIAKKNLKVIMPGFTHFQVAQPITFGHYILSYCEMFKRDIYRFKNFYNLINYLPLGSCALAGTNFKTDRIFLAKKLKFKKICRNSIDAVSDRDYVIDFIYSCSLNMLHISRICEEIIIFSNSIFNFYNLSDKICSGSSIMPQKKNPDSLEVIRSKFGTLLGNLVSFFSIMKSLPLSYNKDYQEDKKIIFSSYKILKNTLFFLKKIFKLIKLKKKRMLEASKKNFSTSTDLADYITKFGVPYKKSHSIVSEIAKKYENKKKNINLLKKYISKKKFKIIEREIDNILNVKFSVKKKKSLGGTCYKNVFKEIKIFKKKIKRCYIKL
ncbi:argininosuccinate lyase [Candidatus Vidania fulgoroideorum]